MTGQGFKGYVVGVGIVVVVGVAAYLAWKAYSVGKVVVTETLNPASDKNAAYGGVNAVGAALTGDDSFSLGSWLYDVTHPGASVPAGSSWEKVVR